ncbi:MAG: sigma-70 family RNA polymerase sigma factor [Owenweeksia sp.]
MGEQELVEHIRHGDEATLGKLYSRYREEFVVWVRKTYGVDAEGATETYQQSVIVLYENAVSGKLQKLSGSLKTYLFAIGKNKVRELMRQRSKVFSMAGEMPDQADEPELEQKMEKEKRLQAVTHSFNQLGEGCKKLLQLFYYQNLRMEEIMLKLGYKNSDTAKNQKYKCMQKLRKIHLSKPQ